jgi:hypothetical protein
MLWPWLPFLLLPLQLLGRSFCTKLGGSLQQDSGSSGHSGHKDELVSSKSLDSESNVECVLAAGGSA